MKETEIIAAAAILVNGEVWWLPRPARHHILIHAWCDSHYKDGKPARLPNGHRQGFITNLGRFVGREEAAKIAFEAGQLAEPKEELFSEDLW